MLTVSNTHHICAHTVRGSYIAAAVIVSSHYRDLRVKSPSALEGVKWNGVVIAMVSVTIMTCGRSPSQASLLLLFKATKPSLNGLCGESNEAAPRQCHRAEPLRLEDVSNSNVKSKRNSCASL